MRPKPPPSIFSDSPPKLESSFDHWRLMLDSAPGRDIVTHLQERMVEIARLCLDRDETTSIDDIRFLQGQFRACEGLLSDLQHEIPEALKAEENAATTDAPLDESAGHADPQDYEEESL